MPEQPIDTDAIELGQGLELQWVQAALATLDLGDKGLGLAQRLGDLNLGQALGVTTFAQLREEGFVLG